MNWKSDWSLDEYVIYLMRLPKDYSLKFDTASALFSGRTSEKNVLRIFWISNRWVMTEYDTHKILSLDIIERNIHFLLFFFISVQHFCLHENSALYLCTYVTQYVRLCMLSLFYSGGFEHRRNSLPSSRSPIHFLSRVLSGLIIWLSLSRINVPRQLMSYFSMFSIPLLAKIISITDSCGLPTRITNV